jgi:triacylglycerol lipase
LSPLAYRVIDDEHTSLTLLWCIVMTDTRLRSSHRNHLRIPTRGMSFSLAGLLLASVAFLPACGDSASSPSNASNTTDAPSTQAPPATPAPTAPGTPDEPAQVPPESHGADEKPVVWSAPIDIPIACGNRRLYFDFETNQTAYSLTNAFWLMWSAMRSFNSEKTQTRDEFASIGFSNYIGFDAPSTGLQAFVAGSDSVVVLAFRGSTEFRDWVGNLDFLQRNGTDFGLTGRIHEGFAKALEPSYEEIKNTVERFSNKGQRVFVTGHSLGGAMALLAAARLAGSGHAIAGLYTFGAPRAGDSALVRDAQAQLNDRYFRIVNDMDAVPHLPPSSKAAAEAGSLLQIGFAKKGLEAALRNLDFAHSGVLLKFDATGSLSESPSAEDDDVAFWHALASHSANGKIWNLLIDNLDQANRHNQRTYLCKMRDAYLAEVPTAGAP